VGPALRQLRNGRIARQTRPARAGANRPTASMIGASDAIRRAPLPALAVVTRRRDAVIAVVSCSAAELVLAAADIPTTLVAARTIRIWIATRHAGQRIRAADLVFTTAERTAGFTRIAGALAGSGIKVLRIWAGGNAVVIAADIVV